MNRGDVSAVGVMSWYSSSCIDAHWGCENMEKANQRRPPILSFQQRLSCLWRTRLVYELEKC